MLEDYSWTFTTTSINPIVLLHTTIGVDVPLDAPIVISFSKMMNGNSVKILLDPYLTLNHSWSQDLTELTLTHPNFQENTTYTVTVKAGALSIFGAPILADYSWSFTTISIPIDAPRDEIPDPDGVPVVAVASIAVIVGIGLVASTEFGMYWFLVLILPLYVRMRKEGVFDNKTRFALHGIIIENPGIHYHALTKELEIPNGSAIYHLSVLEREGYIKTRRDGMRKRFYSDTAKVPEDHKLPPEHLRLQIVMLVSEKPGLTQKAISEEMGITRDVIGYHLRELVKEGYLADSRDGKYTVYHPKRRMMDAK